MGGGLIIRVGDRAQIFDAAVSNHLTGLAQGLQRKDKTFRFQRRLMDAGTCEASVFQAFGYRTGAVCVGLGNYHNRDFRRKRIAAEYVSLRDVESMVTLFVEMVRQSEGLQAIGGKSTPRLREERGDLGERMLVL